ncbi:DUF2066 domain-containing protein [Neiella marina]|uniref:DUF2066 domain-containing protein n=1 Tax=Neiella holothuriorum TaxID=2870530 RepID=A0ABS7EK10_9GAMM|nr:DUF2066 domain-containing protein [Neiella holothuriorum]MBW8192203.1 DUF2066 domain-containing protein [Neiella holothuriorum]
MSRRVVVLLLVLLSPLQLLAAEVANLYTARVDASVKLQSGLSQGFDQVLVRVSGQRAALSNALVMAQRQSVKQYLVQYGYIDDGGKRWLEVTFNQEAVDRLLRQANLPIWGSLRPMTIVWLAAEQDFERELVNEQSPLLENANLRDVLRQRGIPMMQPLLDLDDIMLVDAADIWGNFPGPAIEASSRYSADQMVMAKLYEIGGDEYQIQWSFYQLSNKQPTGIHKAWYQNQLNGSLDTLLPEWLEQMADTLGQQFATQTGLSATDSVQVKIYNLTDLARVLKAEQSLASMAMVSQVALQDFSANQAVFSVNLLGAAADFYQALALDKQLQALEPAFAESEPMNDGEDDDSEPSEPEMPAYMWQM